jgi:hypothetical protein
MLKYILAGCAAAALFSGAASAATVLSDNFDAENGGATALSYNDFKNFSAKGDVDLIAASNPYNISCFGGTGACVDLNGASRGGLITRFFFGAGDTVTLSARIAGGGRGVVNSVSLALVNALTFSRTDITGIQSNAGYTLYSTSFVATAADFAFARISSLDDGVAGAILDDVTIDVTPASGAAVPETATWAMMIAGFGVTGAAMRRRRAPALVRA